MPGHLGVDVIEHRRRVEERPLGHRPVLLRFFPRRRHFCGQLFFEFLVLFFRPLAAENKVLLQALDRIAEREVLPLVLWTVLRRVVARRVSAAPIGNELDHRRAAAAARAIRRPQRCGVDREEVIAVDADARDAEAESARRERPPLAAGKALERRDRPLVVDDIEDNRRLVNGGEGYCVVKIGLGRCAVAEPGGGDMILALDRGRHRPANRVRVLRGEVARDREHVGLRAVVHDRQLPALAHVARVGQALAHHVDQAHAAVHVQRLVAI